MSKLAADVGADQPVAGLPRLRLRSGAGRRRRAAHARRAATSTRRCRACPRCARRSPRSTQHYYGARYDPDTEVTVTSGGTEAIFDAVAAVVHPGDEVDRPRAVLRLVRPRHRAQRRRAGRRPAALSGLPRSTGTRCARAITPRTRLLMINSPHNPTGSILTAERHCGADGDRRRHRHLHRQRRGLRAHHLRRRAAREHGAPSRARRPQLRRRLVRQDVSRHGVEGRLRGGAGGADGGVAQGAPVRHVRTHTPVQHAIAEFLAARTGLDELPSFFQRKRDLFLRLMQGSRFKPLPCRGSYFQLMDYSAITDEPDAEFAIWMTKEHGVASIPDVAVPAPVDGAAGRALLLREEGRDARAGRRRGCAGSESSMLSGRFPAASE